MNYDELFEKIEFEVSVDMIEGRVTNFAEYIKEDDTEETIRSFCTRVAFWVLNKSAEQDEEVPETRGTRRPVNRAERRKETAHAKNRRKALAKYADDEIRTNSGKVINTGYRSYEKGVKVYTRKGRGFRDKFTEDPFNPWGSDDEETMLNLTNNDGYYSDEDIQKAIEESNRWDDDWDLDDGWDDVHGDDWDDVHGDDCIDLDVLVENLQKQNQNLRNYNNQLEEEVRKLHEFLSDFNLETLHTYWRNTHK